MDNRIKSEQWRKEQEQAALDIIDCWTCGDFGYIDDKGTPCPDCKKEVDDG